MAPQLLKQIFAAAAARDIRAGAAAAASADYADAEPSTSSAHPDARTDATPVPSVLLVTPDRSRVAKLERGLGDDLADVMVAFDAMAGLALARRARPDVVVLDACLREPDAVEACRFLRASSDVCVLLVLDRCDDEATVRALSLGADDVVVAPADPRELAARVKALLRRSRHATTVANVLSVEAAIDEMPIGRDVEALPLTGRRLAEAPSISAVLPAYDEEALIEGAVRRVTGVLAGLTADYEVIVVDDGSRDRTGEILADLRVAEPELRLRVVTHEANRGYGAALASGFDATWKDLIFFTDGDEQFDVAELARLLPEMDAHTDLVIGWREQRADPPIRLFNAWGWKQLVNGLFGYTARDVDCAFKLFRRTVWESLTVHARGATFSAELLVKARRLGFRVKEVPVSHFPRRAGSATGARLDVIARAFAELFQLWRSLDRELAEDPRVVRLRATHGATRAA